MDFIGSDVLCSFFCKAQVSRLISWSSVRFIRSSPFLFPLSPIFLRDFPWAGWNHLSSIVFTNASLSSKASNPSEYHAFVEHCYGIAICHFLSRMIYYYSPRSMREGIDRCPYVLFRSFKHKIIQAGVQFAWSPESSHSLPFRWLNLAFLSIAPVAMGWSQGNELTSSLASARFLSKVTWTPSLG